jgi:hypothetical protein
MIERKLLFALNYIKNMKKINNIDSAIDIIIDSANKHAIASEMGDYKTANKNFDLIQKAVIYLRNNNGINKLEELLYHENVSVQLAAASYLLIHDEKKAIAVLENIVKQNIPHKSFDAEMVLSEWRKGNLRL